MGEGRFDWSTAPRKGVMGFQGCSSPPARVAPVDLYILHGPPFRTMAQ